MTGMLDRKVALVTGGGSGIGRAAAIAMAREGASVFVADVNDEGSALTVSAISDSGGVAEAVHADVSSAGDVEAMIGAVMKKRGRIDCAFNNAGVFGRTVGGVGFTHEVSVEAFDKLMAVNLRGVFACMKYEITEMLKQGSGAIVNTSSIAGIRGLGGSAIYSAAKHGVVGLTKAAAIEYAPRNIRVNAVCPGWTMTERSTELLEKSPDWMAQMVNATPAARMGRTNEIAETVVWLCSDRSSFVTGEAIAVDGGFSAGPSLAVFRGGR